MFCKHIIRHGKRNKINMNRLTIGPKQQLYKKKKKIIIKKGQQINTMKTWTDGQTENERIDGRTN